MSREQRKEFKLEKKYQEMIRVVKESYDCNSDTDALRLIVTAFHEKMLTDDKLTVSTKTVYSEIVEMKKMLNYNKLMIQELSESL